MLMSCALMGTLFFGGYGTSSSSKTQNIKKDIVAHVPTAIYDAVIRGSITTYAPTTLKNVGTYGIVRVTGPSNFSNVHLKGTTNFNGPVNFSGVECRWPLTITGPSNLSEVICRRSVNIVGPVTMSVHPKMCSGNYFYEDVVIHGPLTLGKDMCTGGACFYKNLSVFGPLSGSGLQAQAVTVMLDVVSSDNAVIDLCHADIQSLTIIIKKGTPRVTLQKTRVKGDVTFVGQPGIVDIVGDTKSNNLMDPREMKIFGKVVNGEIKK